MVRGRAATDSDRVRFLVAVIDELISTIGRQPPTLWDGVRERLDINIGDGALRQRLHKERSLFRSHSGRNPMPNSAKSTPKKAIYSGDGHGLLSDDDEEYVSEFTVKREGSVPSYTENNGVVYLEDDCKDVVNTGKRKHSSSSKTTTPLGAWKLSKSARCFSKNPREDPKTQNWGFQDIPALRVKNEPDDDDEDLYTMPSRSRASDAAVYASGIHPSATRASGNDLVNTRLPKKSKSQTPPPPYFGSGWGNWLGGSRSVKPGYSPQK